MQDYFHYMKDCGINPAKIRHWNNKGEELQRIQSEVIENEIASKVQLERDELH